MRAKPGHIRLIGGAFRGRQIPVADAKGLRPTQDRIRETLFNWLMNEVHGARCLDMFAGTGALGLEALSRGAAHVTFFEKNSALAKALSDNVVRLDCAPRANVLHADATSYVAQELAFDIVFLDPPFGQNLLTPALAALSQKGMLARGALIYIERASDDKLPYLPESWSCLKSKQTKQVSYSLHTCCDL